MVRTRALRRLRSSAGRTALAVVTTALAVAGCSGAATPPVTGGSAAPPTSGPAVAPAGAVAVPLSTEAVPGRLVADVDVGGAPLRVLVDTGSVGLRVVAGRVPAGTVAPAGPAAPLSYGSGVTVTGTVARAPVRLGSFTGTAPVELVTGTGCVPGRPRCAAANGRAPQTFGGELDGILGIGAGPSRDVPNPLPYLGTAGHTFAIHRDPAGRSTLVLGEPADGYALDQLAPAPGGAWVPRIPVCVDAAPLPGGRACGPALLDTGNAGVALINDPRAAPGPLPGGTPVTIGPPAGGWTVHAVAGPGADVTVGRPPTGNPGSVVGLPALAGLDVRFDLDAGTIGVRRP